ncbi:LOW QUALITY PROTEIN: hypothetical protein PHMEG_0005171 [Phytophthora megakarya]|uniref:DDE-1 domain-containing protein n=1 Tax=Phytophthora megakarya TaxID=4795 RepID=A0A225WS08_9STRA|nr:LOW QUALITY PROTEIN: hypothetical protein PHMEG_0005171 [Phytophthora megakarya]
MQSKICRGGQGLQCSFPNEDAVVQRIKQSRNDFPLKTSHLIISLKEEFFNWVGEYLGRSKEESLYRLLQRLVHRWGFAFRKPNRTVIASIDLERELQAFASSTGAAIRAAATLGLNTYETAVYYDKELSTVIAESGSKKTASVLGRKRSQRASVLLTVSASGKKMKSLVIFKGQPGGVVEKEPHDNRVAVAVQRTGGWMHVYGESTSLTVWGGEFVSTEYPEALTLYCHVSNESVQGFMDWGTEVAPLPKNTTGVLQPLGVGIMGPSKKKLRSLALASEIEGVRDSRLPMRERLLALMRRPAYENRQIVVKRVAEAWDAVSENVSCERGRKLDFNC